MDEQLVIFELNEESYGVNVTQVQSIVPLPEIITVPGAPHFIAGVVNLRGVIIPVVDLRRRFNLPLPAHNAKSVIVVLELEQLRVGLIVDKVTEVAKIPETAIEPPSPLLASIDTAYLRGLGKIKGNGDMGRVVILLDLPRIFSREEQQELTQAQ